MFELLASDRSRLACNGVRSREFGESCLIVDFFSALRLLLTVVRPLPQTRR